MRTNDLKKLVRNKLITLRTTYNLDDITFKHSKDNAVFPHVVFDLTSASLQDLNRMDYILDVHCWNRGTSTTLITNLMDAVEDLFHMGNFPQDSVLPTFFLESRGTIEDEDKLIQHGVLRFTIQNYER